MKSPRFLGVIPIATLLLSILLVGCSDPQKVAVKGLKKSGYEATSEDFLRAAASGDLASFDLFQAAGIDIDGIDRSGNTALIKAAEAGRVDAVERILGLGADPRTVNASGRDALLVAADKGHEEVARMLVSRGADTSQRDKEDWSALALAAYNGHAGVVSLLAASAAPAELDDALLVASFRGKPEVLNTLLGQGANISARSPESKTPLMIASAAGNLEAVRVLLQNRANPYAVDLTNQTAANLALAAGRGEIEHLINHPDTWGASEQGQKVATEMASAQVALTGEGVEEVLLEGMPLAGEPNRGQPTRVGASETATPVAALAPAPAGVPVAAPVAATAPVAGSVGADKPVPSSSPAAVAAPILVATPVNPPVQATGATNPSVASPDRAVDLATRPAATASGTGPGTTATESAATRVEVSRRVREESQNKPIVALNGSTIHSRLPEEAPVEKMVLAAYHEESLPLIVDGVSGTTASVRRLDQSNGSVAVPEGSVVPGTSYKVKEVSTRFISSKEGKGRMVDVSRVMVEDTARGSTHVLVKDVSGQTADTYAILTAPNSQYRYVVKAGDVFRTTQPGIGAKDYQVLDIRANAVVIKDLSTDEVTTVARDGVIVP
jgi:ankyrin repeat protein